MAAGHAVAETTTATREDAERLARAMVERRLAACAQVAGPIRSVYRWEGEIRDEPEFVVRFKTRAELTARLTDELAELHPYDVPEILLFAVHGGSRAYLDWIDAETTA